MCMYTISAGDEQYRPPPKGQNRGRLASGGLLGAIFNGGGAKVTFSGERSIPSLCAMVGTADRKRFQHSTR